MCPICGKKSGSTSVICLVHFPITYTNDGKMVSYTEWVPEHWEGNTFFPAYTEIKYPTKGGNQ